jgi:excisionase family DNA binding protein
MQTLKLLRVKDVAEMLNITLPRAYELIRLGIIPSIALGRQIRVDPRALENFLGEGGKLLEGRRTGDGTQRGEP